MNDRFFRLSVDELRRLPFRHVSSAVDARASTTGLTEWAAIEVAGQLSLSWQWGIVRELIIVVNPMDIRTNALLLDEGGACVSVVEARIHLLERVEQLPWRDVVRAMLRDALRH